MKRKPCILHLAFCLAGLAASAFAQTTTLTINNSTGLINVPIGATPNFAALNVGGVSLALPAGAIVGTTASQALTNKTYNGLNIVGNGGSLTVASGAYLTVLNQLSLAGNNGSTVSFGAGGTVVYTATSQALTNKTLTAPTITSPTGLVKGDVGLGNVSNTSYAHTLTLGNGSVAVGAAGQISAVTDPTNLQLSTGTLALAGFSSITGALPVANGGTGTTTPALVNGSHISVTGTWPNQTVNVNGLAAADIGYSRSGSGMSTRTVGAEIDEMPLTTKGAGGSVDGTTDDTAALQRQLASKGRVRLSQGTIKITDNVSMSTIGQIVEGAGVGEATGTYGTTIYQTASGKNGLQFLSTTDTQTSDGGGLFNWQLRSLRLYTSHAGTGTGFALGTDGGTQGAASCTLSDIKAIGFLTGLDFGYAGVTRAWNVSLDGPGAGTPGSVGLKIHGAQANSQIWIGLAAGNWETAISVNSTTQGFVMLPGDIGASGTSFKETSAGADGIIIGGNWENYTSRMFNLAGDSNNVIIEPGYNLDGSQTNEPYLLNGNKLIFIGHTGTFHSDGSVMQFKGEGHVVLNPNVSINTQGSTINRQWVQGVFPAVGDDGVPPASASNFLGVYLVVPRVPAYGPANLAFVNQKADGTYFMDSLCASSVLLGANTFAGAQTYNGSLTYNSTLTGTGVGSITVNNNGGAALSLRNTGTYYALMIRDATSGADVAGFANNGTGVGQRFYSPAGGSVGAGAFQTNNFSLYDFGTHAMGVGVWNGSGNATPLVADPSGVTVNGVFHLPPIARPGSAAEGDIYVDSSDHHTYEYNGTTWKQLDN